MGRIEANAGCPFYHIEELGGHVPLHNEQMETTIEGLYVAGNITGIEGAKVAISQGKVAGYSILNKTSKGQYENELTSSVMEIEQTRNDAFIQFHPNVKEGKEKLQTYWEQYNR